MLNVASDIQNGKAIRIETPDRPKVTIYHLAMFGVQKIEARLLAHGRKKWAQYEAATFVSFIEKGKRNQGGFVTGYKPYFVIVAGWGHPNPGDIMTPEVRSETGLMVSRTRHMSCSPEWVTEFEASHGEYLAKAGIIGDYREWQADAGQAEEEPTPYDPREIDPETGKTKRIILTNESTAEEHRLARVRSMADGKPAEVESLLAAYPHMDPASPLHEPAREPKQIETLPPISGGSPEADEEEDGSARSLNQFARRGWAGRSSASAGPIRDEDIYAAGR